MSQDLVLSLASATRALTGTVKTTLGEAALALEGSALTVALRDNGPKVNGTLVFVNGKVGEVGDVFNAKRAEGGVYGPHTVLGTVEYSVADGAVILGSVNADIDVSLDTTAAVFQPA